MTTPRWRLILNGKSAGNEELREAVGHWRGQGVQLDVRVTWEDGDAERYVAEAIDHGVDVIVAAGGDGTLSAVAETLAHREEAADALPSLALIPMGTANDFATAAGIPTEPEGAFALIGQTTPRAIDLLRVDADGTPWWCANLASGGFGTQVTVETDAGLKKMLGGLALVLAILIGLYWALRRWAPGRTAGRPMGGLRLVGRLPLGPRKYLGLVKVADQVLVIGVCDGSITTLATIDDPEQVALLSAGDKKAFGKAMAAAGGGAEETK